MLTNDHLLLDSIHHTSSKLISKAPKCTIESFQLLLGAIDYINDSSVETFPKLLNYDDTQINTTTEQLSNSNLIEEQYNTSSLIISDEDEVDENKSEDDSPTRNTINKKQRGLSNSSSHNESSSSPNSNNTPPQVINRVGSHHRGSSDDVLICSCCKRDSTAVSFLKNYSIHSGNIDNYRNTFPDYDVVAGVSCMTCYHKQWRYTKGLYDPSKARGAVNKREGIQKSPSHGQSSSPAASSSVPSSTRKKSSPKRKINNEEFSEDGSSTSRKPRKMSKRRQSSPASNQSELQEDSDSSLIVDNENQSTHSTSTYIEDIAAQQGLHHSLRLVLKFIWVQGNDFDSGVEVYSCPIHLDFLPTTLTSIKSLVIGKLKTKMSGYDCDSIIWCHDSIQTILTDNELQQKSLRNDDVLIVNVK